MDSTSSIKDHETSVSIQHAGTESVNEKQPPNYSDDGGGDVGARDMGLKEDSTINQASLNPTNLPEDWNFPKRNLMKIIAGYYGFIIFGMSDSSIGVLLPSLEAHYKVDYLIVSLAFLSPFTGYGIAALLGDKLHRLVGRWGVCTMGTICELICYVIAATAPPFPVFIVAYGIAGFGNGCLESALNSWMGGLGHANQLLGLLHGFYGLGGIICPATFTAIIGHGVRWNYCYFLMIGMSSISVVFSTYAFWGDSARLYRDRVDSEESYSLESNESGDGDIEGSVGSVEITSKKSDSMMKQVFANRLVWLFAIDLFLYVGAEVAFGGWISTFMIEVRHGVEKDMGYVTTGFWAGLTVGRMVLGFLIGHFKGEDYFVIFFLSLGLVFLLIVWLVPVLIVSAIFAALFGVAIGPLFPTIVVAAMKKLPRRLHVSGVGFCVALGGAGAAIPPFINGVIANKFGPRVLGPFAVVLLGLMLVVWLLVVKLYPSR